MLNAYINTNTTHPLRNAKLVLAGRRTTDRQLVAFFESSEGELLEYEVHGARPPLRQPEVA